MIRVSRNIVFSDSDIEETFIRATGPGGQNVNKVASAVQLRVNLNTASAVPADVRNRLAILAGRRLTEAGILIIEARRFRTQERNRQDARERLIRLVRQAMRPPKPRRSTRPTAASKRRRLDNKRMQGERKRSRKRVSPADGNG